MVNTILVHLAANADHHRGFHMGIVVWDTEMYFKLRNYSESIVDIIIIAIIYALHLNLTLYQKVSNGNVEFIQQTHDSRGTAGHLKFMHNQLNPLSSH